MGTSHLKVKKVKVKFTL